MSIIPLDVVDCGKRQNVGKCGDLCVGDKWFSKVTKTGYVNAHQICVDKGYDGVGSEYGGNHGVQCKYPGKRFGKPNFGGKFPNITDFTKFGQSVSWKCGESGKFQTNFYLRSTF